MIEESSTSNWTKGRKHDNRLTKKARKGVFREIQSSEPVEQELPFAMATLDNDKLVLDFQETDYRLIRNGYVRRQVRMPRIMDESIYGTKLKNAFGAVFNFAPDLRGQSFSGRYIIGQIPEFIQIHGGKPREILDNPERRAAAENRHNTQNVFNDVIDELITKKWLVEEQYLFTLSEASEVRDHLDGTPYNAILVPHRTGNLLHETAKIGKNLQSKGYGTHQRE
jgi:hypothetical protein